MIIVAGTIRVPPENMEALRPYALRVIEATRAEAGCMAYSFAEDLVEPGLIRIYEIWESRAHLDAHGRAPHMDPWRAAVAANGVSGRDIRGFEAGPGEPL
jgi:quinol monooxygenase YgiN